MGDIVERTYIYYVSSIKSWPIIDVVLGAYGDLGGSGLPLNSEGEFISLVEVEPPRSMPAVRLQGSFARAVATAASGTGTGGGELSMRFARAALCRRADRERARG